jgi:amino acid transporter
MPEDSINIFVSNIYTVAIFTGVFLVIFFALFFLSGFLHKKIAGIKDDGSMLRKNEPEKKVHIRHAMPGLFEVKKDISFLKTLLSLGIIMVMVIFFLLLIILSIHFTTSFKMDGSIYIIFLLIFLIVLSAVYATKSNILK